MSENESIQYVCEKTGEPCAVVPWNGYKPCDCKACSAYWYYQGTDD